MRIIDEGPGFDGRSMVYDYLASRSPCVIGCLWTVTDRDIDRFFMSLASYCFPEKTAAKRRAKLLASPT